MTYNNDFFNLFCYKFFDKEVTSVFTEVVDKIDADSDFSERYSQIINEFMGKSEGNEMVEVLKKLPPMAKEIDTHEYTLNSMFLISCAEILCTRYKEKGFSDELFWDTIADIKYKTYECIFCKDIVGTFIPTWFIPAFTFDMFQFGIFQYEKIKFTTDFVTRNGKQIKKGALAFNLHIPASGASLKTELCMESFRKAYQFYKDDLEGNIMLIKCGSWLLNPDHPKFLPEGMNILSFMKMFDMYETYEAKDYLAEEGCRFFGNCFNMTYEELPENTRLQRAYKKYLLEGNKPLNARGVILFDGENIVN